MAAPAFQAVGSAQTGIGSISVAWPAHVIGDVGILVVDSSGIDPYISAGAGISGWTLMNKASPGGLTTDCNTEVFFRVATSGAESNASVPDSGDHTTGRIYTFRGVGSDLPLNTSTSTGTKTSASTSFTTPSVTSLKNNSLVVMVVGRGDDSSSTTAFSTLTHSGLTSIGDPGEAGSVSGDGGGFVLFYGNRATTGSTGAGSGTQVPSTTNAMVTFALYGTDPTFSQAAYRFYEDGTETGSVAIDAQNTNITRSVTSDSNLQLRVRFQETAGGEGATNDTYLLQYSLNSGTYTIISTSSTVAKAFDSTSLTNSDPTTNRLGAGTGSFVAGKISETGSVTNNQVTASNYTEFLYSITLLSSDVADGDTLDFRILRRSLTTGLTYTVTPRITVSKSSVVNATITQVAGSVTATGGTQTIASTQNATVTQIAGTVTVSGGTQAASTVNNVAITQAAATVTASGGTQTVATVNNVSLAQIAGVVTATGGTQAIATSNFVAISQVAATVTASGGTQVVQTNASITQTAATVTATGGTESIATVNIVSITQVAGTVTASGGTQTIATVNDVAISQVAATVTATGGTEVIATVNNVVISQVAGTVTAAGGTQVVSTVNNVSITQVAATVTATGGTEALATINNVAVTQVAGNVTATGGTQTVATSNFVAISQTAATVTASGGTQTIASAQYSTIAQLAGTVTASGGTQSIGSVISASVAQVAGVVTATAGTQGITAATGGTTVKKEVYLLNGNPATRIGTTDKRVIMLQNGTFALKLQANIYLPL